MNKTKLRGTSIATKHKFKTNVLFSPTGQALSCGISLTSWDHCSGGVAPWTRMSLPLFVRGCSSQQKASGGTVRSVGAQGVEHRPPSVAQICFGSYEAPDCSLCPGGTVESSPRWKPRGWAAAPPREAVPTWGGRPAAWRAPLGSDGWGSRRRWGWRRSRSSRSRWPRPPVGLWSPETWAPVPSRGGRRNKAASSPGTDRPPPPGPRPPFPR